MRPELEGIVSIGVSGRAATDDQVERNRILVQERMEREAEDVARVLNPTLREGQYVENFPGELTREQQQLRASLVWQSVSRNPLRRVRGMWRLRRNRASLFPGDSK